MRKPIITVDCDNVLADSAGAFVEFYNTVYDADITLDHITERRFKNCTQLTKHDPKNPNINDTFEEYVHMLADVKPILSATTPLLRLKEKGYHLIVLTGRVQEMEEITHTWINTYFPNIFEKIIFNYELTDQYRPKGEICHEIGSIAHVDDFHHNAVSISEHNIKTLLFDRPRNTPREDRIDNPYIVRVSGRDEVEKHIE